jgi:hypothetical protein
MRTPQVHDFIMRLFADYEMPPYMVFDYMCGLVKFCQVCHPPPAAAYYAPLVLVLVLILILVLVVYMYRLCLLLASFI